MKKIIISMCMLSWAIAATAQVGRVISSTPITQSVALPQQVCQEQYVNQGVYAPNGGNAVLGAIAGGLIGGAVGGGHRRGGYNGGAIALGALGGAAVGSQINGYGGYVTRPVTQCQTQNSYRNQITGYQVVYEVNGETYTTQTSSPPGAYMDVGSGYGSQGNYGNYGNSYGNHYNTYQPPSYRAAPVYGGSTYGNGYSTTYGSPYPVYRAPVAPVYVAPPVYYMPPPPVYYRHRHHRGW